MENEKKNKNNKIIVIAILVAVIIALSVALAVVIAGNNKDSQGELIPVTELVTDAQGEPVTDAQGELVTEIVQAEAVTDASGEVVTEVVTGSNQQPVTYKNGTTVTRVVTKPSGKKKTTTTKKADNGGSTNKNEEPSVSEVDANSSTQGSNNSGGDVISQPDPPAAVKGIKVSDIKKDSIKLSWNKLDCSGYQIRYSIDGKNWSYELTTSTSITLKDLISNTEYIIQIRGYVEYAGSKIASKQWVEIRQTTKVNEEKRKINITYTLPVKGKTDKLIIYVKKDGKDEKWEKDSEIEVACDGGIYSIETKNEYKGLVTVRLRLKESGIDADSELTDKAQISLSLVDTNIGVVQGEDDV